MQAPRKPPVGIPLCGLSFLVVGLLAVGCQSARERQVFSPWPAVADGDHGNLSEAWIDGSSLFHPPRRITVTNASNARVYSVSGQVRQPGRQMYIGATTVTKAIQSAGDFTDFAARERVKLVRINGEVLEVNCLKLHAPDPPVYPGDTIDVPQRNFWDLFR